MNLAETWEQKVPEPEIEVVAEVAVGGLPMERVHESFAYLEILATASSTALRRILGSRHGHSASCLSCGVLRRRNSRTWPHSACRRAVCLQASMEALIFRPVRKTVFQMIERNPGVELLFQEERRIAVHPMEDIDAFAAHRTDPVAQHDTPGGTDAVAEEQHILGCQARATLRSESCSKQVLADDHAGKVHKAPVLQHHTGEIGNFDAVGGSSDSRLTVVMSDSAETSEMVMEFVAPFDRGPVTVRIKT